MLLCFLCVCYYVFCSANDISILNLRKFISSVLFIYLINLPPITYQVFIPYKYILHIIYQLFIYLSSICYYCLLSNFYSHLLKQLLKCLVLCSLIFLTFSQILEVTFAKDSKCLYSSLYTGSTLCALSVFS